MEHTNVITDQPGPKTFTLRKMRIGILDGPNAGEVHEFDRDVIQIGSQKNCDVRLADDTVSRAHALILRTSDGVILRDLGSTNGTFVGDVRVKEVYLAEHGTFRVGLTHLVFTPQDEVVDIVPAPESSFEGMVGESRVMRELFSVLNRVAATDLTVLITGETGTGKELASAAIHARSKRRNKPFVVFDCGAAQPNLVESELFGHQRGAFTGAVADRAGLFEQAHGGTLFLDELGELPLAIQSTLLRVLEQREVRRVGGRRVIPVDVRIVAATNRDLTEEIAAGRFRQDLYYRLAVVETHLPPLRDRRDDFGLLCRHLLNTAPFEHAVTGLSEPVMAMFSAWHWPGNVRELRNAILRALSFCEGPLITLDALPEGLRRGSKGTLETRPPVGADPFPGAALSFKEAKETITTAFERHYLQDLLQRADGNVSRAARMAGVDRKTLSRMMKRHAFSLKV